jgi:mercuric ion binding protein
MSLTIFTKLKREEPMKQLFIVITLSAALLNAVPVVAASQTVKLSVPGMTCPVCPITVKKALSLVKGVNTVLVNFENKMAVVTFDDAMANVDELTQATAGAGYPSSVMQ